MKGFSARNNLPSILPRSWLLSQVPTNVIPSRDVIQSNHCPVTPHLQTAEFASWGSVPCQSVFITATIRKSRLREHHVSLHTRIPSHLISRHPISSHPIPFHPIQHSPCRGSVGIKDHSIALRHEQTFPRRSTTSSAASHPKYQRQSRLVQSKSVGNRATSYPLPQNCPCSLDPTRQARLIS